MELKQYMSLIVESKYKLIKKLGEGSFGKIFTGINKNTNESVAIKIEAATEISVLRNEARIYTLLREIEGVPNMRAWGKEGKFNYLVLDHLGKSLEDLRIQCGKTLGLKTVLAMGIQMIKRIEQVHAQGIIHRDIKPDNFLLGVEPNQHLLYLIDFGLAKMYIKNRAHVSIDHNRKLTGTARYVSLNVHEGILPSRRDDMESIGYILIYLLIGELPWQGLNGINKYEKHKLIGERKRDIKLWDRYQSSVPGEIFIFINYCRNLKYEEEPDYQYLKSLLINLYTHHGFITDNIYDWIHHLMVPKDLKA